MHRCVHVISTALLHFIICHLAQYSSLPFFRMLTQLIRCGQSASEDRLPLCSPVLIPYVPRPYCLRTSRQRIKCGLLILRDTQAFSMLKYSRSQRWLGRLGNEGIVLHVGVCMGGCASLGTWLWLLVWRALEA